MPLLLLRNPNASIFSSPKAVLPTGCDSYLLLISPAWEMLQTMQEYQDVGNEEVFIMSSLLVICSANIGILLCFCQTKQ
jgi:hypothetical protein